MRAFLSALAWAIVSTSACGQSNGPIICLEYHEFLGGMASVLIDIEKNGERLEFDLVHSSGTGASRHRGILAPDIFAKIADGLLQIEGIAAYRVTEKQAGRYREKKFRVRLTTQTKDGPRSEILLIPFDNAPPAFSAWVRLLRDAVK